MLKDKLSKLEEQVKLYKTIVKNNDRFNKLSKMEKRVAIAKDVLEQIKIKKFKPAIGGYLNLDEPIEEEINIQELLITKETTCRVCAIGGIFASKVILGNKCDTTLDRYDTGLDDDIMIDNLKSIFSEKELRKIEYAFEGFDVSYGDMNFSDKECSKYETFFESFENTEHRLKAIMLNIIKNKGKFVVVIR